MPEEGPARRPRRPYIPGEPQLIACRWRAVGCLVARMRPEAHPPAEPLLDCGAPACAARSAAYRAELAAARSAD